MKKLFVVFIVLAISFAIIGFLMKKKDTWNAFPSGTIVDTPEEFQRINTP